MFEFDMKLDLPSSSEKASLQIYQYSTRTLMLPL